MRVKVLRGQKTANTPFICPLMAFQKADASLLFILCTKSRRKDTFRLVRAQRP